ncbi:MAG: helix-turn-helix transcriptional regulator, partial [Bacteroidia bacterium]|nr:helix-turn-helix transcriptional regulator [Bacteroidia bacterium]
DCDLIGIAMSPYLLSEILPKEDILFFTQVGESRRVLLEENEQSLFKEMAELYLKVLIKYGESSKFSKSLSASILQFAMRACSSDSAKENTSNNRADEICKKFIALLGQTKGTKRRIEWFAQNLCISSHYLSIAVKQSSGKSVKNLIDNAVITEIKVLLRHSDMSISQISDKLEFPSSSFLCKYFKAHTGITPLHYRNNR